VHLVAYFAGFFSFSETKELQEGNLFGRYFNGAVWIGVLLSILVFILWMNKYFKQNAFKSFYPKKNASLFAEFVLIFIICFLNISFCIPYTEGFRQRISNSISTEQLEYEVDIVNKGEPFTLQGYNYRHIDRCVSAPVFDSLVSEEEVLKLYVENRVDECRKYEKKNKNITEKNSSPFYKKWKNVNPKDYLLYKDSLPQPYYANSEYTKLLKKHFPERMPRENEEEEEEEEEDNDKFSPYGYNDKHIKSIYNYSTYPILVKPIEKSEIFDTDYYEEVVCVDDDYDDYVGDVYINYQKCKAWQQYAIYVADLLQNNKKEEIEKLLDNYLSLADKYAVSYQFKNKQWIDYVYNPPYYFADYDLSTMTRYDRYDNVRDTIDHIKAYDLNSCMQNLITSKSNVIKLETVLILLYIALFFAILIYAFRITTLRIWLMSFAGAIVVLLLFGAVYALSNVAGVIDSDGIWAINQCFVFILIFWLFTIFCMWKGKMKKFSGMALNWGIVTFPCIFPLILERYTIYLKEISKTLCPNHPHYVWINDHVLELGLLNILLFFIFLFLLMPAIKKWKALPEE
jgi:hypothetical protein